MPLIHSQCRKTVFVGQELSGPRVLSAKYGRSHTRHLLMLVARLQQAIMEWEMVFGLRVGSG